MSNFRSALRHEIPEEKQILIETFQDREDSADPPLDAMEARIVNISKNGIKLRSATPFQFHDKLLLKIPSFATGNPITVSAEVRWTVPDKGTDTWSAGCVLSEEFPDEFIHEIARMGLIERRQSVRKQIQIKADGRPELTSGTVDVELRDVSVSGFRFNSPISFEPGKRIQVKIQDEDLQAEDFVVRAMRCDEEGEGYSVGCKLLQGSTYRLLALATGVAPAKKPKSVSRGILVGGASLTLVLLLRVWLGF